MGIALGAGNVRRDSLGLGLTCWLLAGNERLDNSKHFYELRVWELCLMGSRVYRVLDGNSPSPPPPNQESPSPLPEQHQARTRRC